MTAKLLEQVATENEAPAWNNPLTIIILKYTLSATKRELLKDCHFSTSWL